VFVFNYNNISLPATHYSKTNSETSPFLGFSSADFRWDQKNRAIKQKQKGNIKQL